MKIILRAFTWGREGRKKQSSTKLFIYIFLYLRYGKRDQWENAISQINGYNSHTRQNTKLCFGIFTALEKNSPPPLLTCSRRKQINKNNEVFFRKQTNKQTNKRRKERFIFFRYCSLTFSSISRCDRSLDNGLSLDQTHQRMRLNEQKGNKERILKKMIHLLRINARKIFSKFVICWNRSSKLNQIWQ